MRELVAGSFILGLGCIMFFRYRHFAHAIIRFQNEVWGFSFGEREERISRIVCVVVGTVLIYGGLRELIKAIQR